MTTTNNDGWEASAKFMYNIKTKNKDFRPDPASGKLDYKSGQEFHMDYLLGKHIGQWGIGISGYYLKQTTNDKVDGNTLPAAAGPWSTGRKGQVFAYGPTVSYTTSSGVMISGQWPYVSA